MDNVMKAAATSAIPNQVSNRGMKALKDTVSRTNTVSESTLKAISHLSDSSPLLRKIFNKEGLAAIGIMGTVAVSHSLIRKFLQGHSKRLGNQNHLGQMNQVQHTSIRDRPNDSQFAEQPGIQGSELNMKSQIKTSYNLGSDM